MCKSVYTLKLDATPVSPSLIGCSVSANDTLCMLGHGEIGSSVMSMMPKRILRIMKFAVLNP